ncbi:MAG: hypothetical protein ACK5TN_00645 [Acidobacteriota bacterium]|jgi:hypothetical protein
MRSITFLLMAGVLWPAVIIEEYKLVTDEGILLLRPKETVGVQVRAYGRIEQEGEQTRRGRVEPGTWSIRTLEQKGGWFSKPYKFQGKDEERIERDQTSGWKSVLGQAARPFLVKDTVLYTAPDTPGTYTLEASTTVAGRIVSAQLKLEVSARAVSRWVQPQRNFQQESPDTYPYRKLAQHYAPYIAQETWFQPRADYLHRFDFDGDWHGDNNWDNLDKGSPQAYVYYAAMETRTHWFLHYNFFHPRDYSDNCVVGTCHENDNEGVILTVRKDGSEFGQLELLETLAHNNVYTYTNRRDLRPRLHNIDGPLDLVDGSHPVVFLEAGGHGALGGGDRKSFFDGKGLRWKQNTGVTYRYKGVPEIPFGGIDSEIGYDLLSIYDHWWLKHEQREAWKENTFADFNEYQPYGNRPRPKNPVISSAFRGIKYESNKARPFWGWFDAKGRKQKVLAPGQWALDPAYSVPQSLTWPRNEAWATDYIYNPYLGVEGPAQ